MDYAIRLKDVEVEVIEVSLPEGLKGVCFEGEFPDTLFIECTLSVETKARIVAMHIAHRRMVKAVENSPFSAVDASVLDK